MISHGRLMVVTQDLADLKGVLSRASGIPLLTVEEIPAESPPVDVVAVMIPHYLIEDIAWLPPWTRRMALIVYGENVPAKKMARLSEDGAFIVVPGKLAELNIRSIYQSAHRYFAVVRERDHFQSALVRIDSFGRRITTIESPSALMDYIPNMLSVLLPFDTMAIWDIPQKDLRLFVPGEWDTRQVELVTVQARKILKAFPQAPELPATTTRSEFHPAGRTPPAGVIKHHLVAHVGAWRGLLAVFRTADLAFAHYDDKLFDLAADLITSALHNARLIDRLEDQARKIIKKNRELMAANRMKTNFIANISHELKTPLHSIMGLTDLLTETESAGELEHIVKRLSANGRHMLEFINELLDYSLLLADKAQVYPELIQLEPFVHELMDSVRELAAAKGLGVQLAVDTKLTAFRSDREKVFRILINLLSNAIKYTPAGQVTCRVQSDQRALTFTVVDTGTGIPKDQLERIFEQFHRVDGPLQSKTEGAGLGLTIAQSLTRLLGGQLQVQSQVNFGSSFRLALPLGESVPAAAVEQGPPPSEGDLSW